MEKGGATDDEKDSAADDVDGITFTGGGRARGRVAGAQ